jgi:hypothetical protein
MGEKDRKSIEFCVRLGREMNEMGPDSFGGQDIPYGCLPDYHFTKCPHRVTGLQSESIGYSDPNSYCKLTDRPDADHKGFGCDLCSFIGDSYKDCPNFVAEEKRKSLEAKVD